MFSLLADFYLKSPYMFAVTLFLGFLGDEQAHSMTHNTLYSKVGMSHLYFR